MPQQPEWNELERQAFAASVEQERSLQEKQKHFPVELPATEAECETLVQLVNLQVRLGLDTHAYKTLERLGARCPEGGTRYARAVQRAKWYLGLEQPPPVPTHEDRFWQSAPAEETGASEQALAAHLKLCQDTRADACLVVHKGRIVQEYYAPWYNPPVYAMSCTKSITSLLIGLLLEEGKLPSLDQPVCHFLPEWCDLERRAVTVRHLITMTAGLSRRTDQTVMRARDPNAFVIGLRPDFPPGTAWAYSNEGVQLLSPIIARAAGMPVQEYARLRLFQPLGMTATALGTDRNQQALTYADMLTTPREMARIGLMMLQQGRWQGRQVVSAEWVRESTSPSQGFNPGYGYLWWLIDKSLGFGAMGDNETSIYVFPAWDLVVVRAQLNPRGLRPELRFRPKAFALFRQIALNLPTEAQD